MEYQKLCLILKDANLFGRKTVCGRWDSKDVNPENIRVFPLSGFSMVKPVRRMSVRPKIVLRRLKNRLQQNGKSFAADCTVILFLLFHEKNGMVHE